MIYIFIITKMFKKQVMLYFLFAAFSYKAWAPKWVPSHALNLDSWVLFVVFSAIKYHPSTSEGDKDEETFNCWWSAATQSARWPECESIS